MNALLHQVSKTAVAIAVVYSTATVANAQAVKASSEEPMQDIVVTARRTAESAQKIPVSITAFSGESLRNKVVQSAVDIQKETPSLGIRVPTTSPSGLAISMRGQVSTDVNATAAGSVGIYLDDTYLSSAPIAGSILNMDDLERVEILKGPQGTLYGRNVTGGVVKFVTQKPTHVLEGSLTAGVGNYDRRFLEGVINVPLSDKAAFRILGSVDDHGGYSHDIQSNRDLEDQRKWNVRGSLSVEPTENFSILVQGWYGRFRTNGPDTRYTYLQPGVNSASMNIMVYEHINGLTAADLAPIARGAAGGYTPTQIAAANALANAALPQV